MKVRKRAYKVSRYKQQFIGTEIKELLAKEIICPSISPWASPVVIVPKKDGGSRFCIDYRGLNMKTHLDAYPMPQIPDILESLHGAAVFTTLDLKSGYWQMEMEADSIQKTAFVTSSGLFEFLRLPFWIEKLCCFIPKIDGTCTPRFKRKMLSCIHRRCGGVFSERNGASSTFKPGLQMSTGCWPHSQSKKM